jgi:rSAM/selenodomain-associated transferase 2/rSAM/selenodomain-associated transferase 1
VLACLNGHFWTKRWTPDYLIQRDRVIIFTRYPRAGTTKKRMIPLLGTDGAAELQRQMTLHVVDQVVKLRAFLNVDIVVYYHDDYESQNSKQLMKEWLGHSIRYKKQIKHGSLGDKIIAAVADAIECNNDIDRVIVIGSDCPDVDDRILMKAFNILRNNDCCIGPALDGGYYLIGLNKNVIKLNWRNIFQNVDWGTEKVFKQSLIHINNCNLSLKILDELGDVDLPSDIEIWRRSQKAEEDFINDHKISIIIPVLNEESGIIDTLDSCYCGGAVHNVEVLVVDGGSKDHTVRTITDAIDKHRYDRIDVRVISLTCSKGKSYQLNRGVQEATGSIFLFLHGDTLLPERYDRLVRATVRKDSGYICGAFRFQLPTEYSGNGVDLMQRCTNWRAYDFQFPYGDQALFMKAKVLYDMKGFPEMPFMEDYELVRRLRSAGRIGIVNESIITSARRWQKGGLWVTMVKNQIFVLLYHLGASPEQIKLWYYRGIRLTHIIAVIKQTLLDFCKR